MTHVQFGCGHEAHPGWLNFDSSPTITLERIPILNRLYSKNAVRFAPYVRRGDIVKGLPLPPASATAVYCSHTLEHLALDEFRIALRNTRALLVPGGTFRFVLPDLEHIARAYLASPEPCAAHRFLEESMLGVAARPRGLVEFLKRWIGGSKHLWMWDYKAMAHELAAAGFVEIRRAAFGDAADPKFNEVENIGRWNHCLGVECRRPVGTP